MFAFSPNRPKISPKSPPRYLNLISPHPSIANTSSILSYMLRLARIHTQHLSNHSLFFISTSITSPFHPSLTISFTFFCFTHHTCFTRLPPPLLMLFGCLWIWVYYFGIWGFGICGLWTTEFFPASHFFLWVFSESWVHPTSLEFHNIYMEFFITNMNFV